MGNQTFLQQQAHLRLREIEDKATSLVRYAQRCHTLVDQGLAADVEGLRSHEVVAQYAELMAVQASTMRAQADALVQQLRGLSA